MWVLARVEVNIGNVVFAASPDHYAAKRESEARLKVDAAPLFCEISDYEL
jgi:hypothetical protein